MPLNPHDIDVAAILRDHERRIQLLEQSRQQYPRSVTAGAPVPIFDANVAFNGDAESGTVGWQMWWTAGGALDASYLTENTAAPMQGLRSFELAWNPGAVSAVNGRRWGQTQDRVMPCAPGQTWRASMRVHVLEGGSITINAGFTTGVAAVNTYPLFDPSGAYVNVASATLTPSSPTTDIVGTALVPAGHHYIGFQAFLVFTTDPQPVPPRILIDNVVLQRQI